MLERTSELVALGSVDLRHLSDIYDLEDTYLSIYMPTHGKGYRNFQPYLKKRISHIRKALDKGELLDNFNESLKTAEEWLQAERLDGEKGRVIFVSQKAGLLQVHRLPLAVEAMVVLDTSPYIKPLALLRDDYYDYGIVLIDSHQLRLVKVSSGVISDEKKDSASIMNKHKKGGQSQMRFQRIRKGAIHSFLTKAIEDIGEVFYEDKGDYWRGIILGGPGTPKKELLKLLPHDIAADVIDVLDMDFEITDLELVVSGQKAAMEDEKKRGHMHLQQFRSAIIRGEGAAFGLDDVTDAVRSGRASLLLLQRDLDVLGFICENCQALFRRVDSGMKCPNCSGPLSKVDVIEELLEFAERTGAEVEFVKGETFLEDMGGMGAMLRF
jgi:peptide chain release factor subunit 1